jgi:hypothetical protein
VCRLERVPLSGEQDLPAPEVPEWNPGLIGEADHLGAILRLARVVLLAVRESGGGLGGDDDARLCTVDPRFERAGRRRDLAVLVLFRRFAQVPDVSAPVLGVVVVCDLGGRGSVGDRVMNDFAVTPLPSASFSG